MMHRFKIDARGNTGMGRNGLLIVSVHFTTISNYRYHMHLTRIYRVNGYNRNVN